MFAASKGSSFSKGLAFTYLGDAFSTAALTSYSFGNFTSTESGIFVVMFTSRGSSARSISSITVGGDSSTLIGASTSTDNNVVCGHLVKTAGTYNVTVNLSGSRGGPADPASTVSVWLLTNYNSSSPVDSAITGKSSASNGSVSINTESQGISIYALLVDTDNAITISWSGASSQYLYTGRRKHDHAYVFPTATQSGYTETASWSGSFNRNLIGVSFR
jgi:hypothetical protein